MALIFVWQLCYGFLQLLFISCNKRHIYTLFGQQNSRCQSNSLRTSANQCGFCFEYLDSSLSFLNGRPQSRPNLYFENYFHSNVFESFTKFTSTNRLHFLIYYLLFIIYSYWMQIFFGSVKNRNASNPPSRPTPESFCPPKGVLKSRNIHVFTQTIPVCNSFEN